MAWGDYHSHFVAWMKIILPLAALGLLSTLFLISRTIDPTKSVQVTPIDLTQRAQDQGATNPTFSGVTGSGDLIMFRADIARPDANDPELLIASQAVAQLRLTGGTVMDITSDKADMHQAWQTANLNGNVIVTTSNGYHITTDALAARFDELYAETLGPIAGTGPPGDLTAGRMRLNNDPLTGEPHLLFTDGVKLLYDPKTSRE